MQRLHNSVAAATTCEAGIVSEPCREPFELLFADGLDLLDDGPLEAFGAWGRREGAIITPVLGHVEAGEEGADRDLRWNLSALLVDG